MVLEQAVAAGVRYLAAARDSAGWWRDFEVAGPSDAWVTGYVGTALATVPTPDAAALARRGWHLLRRERWWSAGWGYARWVPPDADSTTWALLLAQALGVRGSVRVTRGSAFLTRHLRPGGGLATFSLPDPIRRFTRLPDRFAGWCAPHTCVTAAAAGLTRFSCRASLLQHLRETQRDDGRWEGYWWADPLYATALATRALGPGDEVRLEKAARWASNRVDRLGAVAGAATRDGSPFATALAIEVLCRDPGREARGELQRAVEWLLAAQWPDGSWAASATLRVPPPDVREPELLPHWGLDGSGEGSIGNIVLDTRAVFTTATAVRALHAVCSLHHAG